MKKDKEILLGVCPIGKFVFSNEAAIIHKEQIYNKLNEMGINYCDLESVLPYGLVREQSQVETVVEYFRSKKIDALFVPHCNFGTEGAVGMIAKKLNLPTLLWGPRDDAPREDGSRLCDTICGLFASSKVLNKLKVPFTYIENCHIDDEAFHKGVKTFLGAANVSKALKGMKIGQIGSRIDFFWTTIDNENELLRKFGIQVYPFDIYEVIESTKKRASKYKSDYSEELSKIKEWVNIEGIDTSGLIRSLAYRDELLSMAEEFNIDAFSIQSFNSLQNAIGEGLGLGELFVQDILPIAAESDIHGAVSSVILEAASMYGSSSFFPEFTSRHPSNDNAILLWHASAPLAVKHPDVKKIDILPPWILKGLPATSMQFKIKEGPVTVCRFDGEEDDYRLGFGKGEIVPGPYTREVYGWLEVDNLKRWERKLIEGPYIHHCSCIYGDYTDILEEACKYILELQPEKFNE